MSTELRDLLSIKKLLDGMALTARERKNAKELVLRLIAYRQAADQTMAERTKRETPRDFARTKCKRCGADLLAYPTLDSSNLVCRLCRMAERTKKT